MTGMIGADAEALGRAAQQLRAAAGELESHASGLSAVLGGIPWVGSFAARFLSTWTGQHRTNLAGSAQFFRDAAATLDAQAAEQRVASDSSGAGGSSLGGGAGAAGGSDGRPRSDRLDSAAARHQVLEREAGYLERARGFREKLPNAHRLASAWLEELQSGDPSPEEVAAFESYMATAKLAFLNQMVVRDAASHAFAEFLEAGKAGGAAIGGITQFGGESAEAFATRAMKELGGFADDTMFGGLMDRGAEGLHLPELAGDAYLARYMAEADAALVDLESEFRDRRGVGYSDPFDLARVNSDSYRSQLDVAVQRAEFADAFNPIAGDGSVLDGALRSGLKIAGGPLTARALSAMEIAGNGAQATYHLQSGLAAMSVLGNGVPSVYEMARSVGAGSWR